MMNSRYLFRGKRLDNDAWETGSLVVIRGGTLEEKRFITDKMTGYNTPINSATIGQCTGMKDKNGQLIFEEDILKWTRADIKNPETLCGAVKWRSDQWHVIYDFEYDRWWILSAVVDRLCEIIGNIHDNPELMDARLNKQEGY